MAVILSTGVMYVYPNMYLGGGGTQHVPGKMEMCFPACTWEADVWTEGVGKLDVDLGQRM